MTNKKRKGFTIVELVIVIAVIAILAGVLIPTFTSIIDKANQSTDIQAVRQMNVLLKAESVDKTLEFNDVIEIVSKAGYDTKEKRTPKSANHGFYWHSDTNTIILVKTTNPAELIYPQDNQDLTRAFGALEDSWTTGHDGFEDLAVEGESSEGIKTAEELKAALEAGETIKLGSDITIETAAQAFKIPSGTTASLDLNRHKLTIAAPDNSTAFENEIFGKLTITDSSKLGEIVIQGSDYVNRQGLGAFWVRGGTLNIDGVNVEGNREYNIYSQGGEINLTDTIYTIKYGRGIFSAGTTTIKGGQFIAAGDYVLSVKNGSGTMTISGTEFKESPEESPTESVSYLEGAPIALAGGNVTLENVKVNTGEGNDNNVYAERGAIVNINNGEFNGKFKISGNELVDTCVYISGATVYSSYISEDGNITNKDFQELEASYIKDNIKDGLAHMILCTYNNKTTIVFRAGLTPLNALAQISKDFTSKDEDGTITEIIIPEGSTVVLDNEQETILTQNMLIKGRLEINGGILFAGDRLDSADPNTKNITVFDGGEDGGEDDGTLVLNANSYGKNKGEDSYFNLATFLGWQVVTAPDGYITSQSGNTITAVPDEQ